ncbi:hypothetical protein ACVBAX_03390 [Robertmurraya sp. GLU-23]
MFDSPGGGGEIALKPIYLISQSGV